MIIICRRFSGELLAVFVELLVCQSVHLSVDPEPQTEFDAAAEQLIIYNQCV